MVPTESTLIAKGVVQGCLLSCDAKHLPKVTKEAIQDGRANASTRQKPVSDQHLLLVLSQDCDINNSDDHYIEVLAVKPVPKKKISNKQQSNRNYRKLQVPAHSGYLQLEADLISIIPKQCLENCELLIDSVLDERSKDIVIDWRVGRYSRLPFPDKFNRDFLGAYVKNSEFDLGTYLEQHNEVILDLFVYVSPKDEEQADEYRVSITALLDESCADELMEEIRETLLGHCHVLHDLPNSLKMIQADPSYSPDNYDFSQDLVLKTSDFTLLDSKHLRRITLDYLCYS